ncbi:hypothetical protein ACFHW2_04235 [Actinomadura sp. LOL_016]|uniref:hypothetical protein n=1 Tax=unclassified Actinomadura TaxID=2626254 RepID=UPI003A807658
MAIAVAASRQPLQLLVAAAFVTIPMVRHRYGPAAKAAAEAELARQDVPTTVLEENGLKFDAGGHETAAPVAIAAILYSQLTAATSVRAAFERKGDPTLPRIDVRAPLEAAEGAFPRWVMPTLQNIRHTIVFAGSAVALLAVTLA